MRFWCNIHYRFILRPCAQVNENGVTPDEKKVTPPNPDEKNLIGYFAILPDELAILTVDGSLKMAVKLGSTCKELKIKLQRSGASLRAIAASTVYLRHYEQSGYHIGEVVWHPRQSPPGVGFALRVNHLHGLATQLPHLHTIWISPHPVFTETGWAHGEEYKQKLIYAYVGAYGILAWFAIVERSIQIKVRPVVRA